MKKKRLFLSLVAILLLPCMIWVVWGNVTVGLTYVTITQKALPSGFDGYRVAHVSDLHNSSLWMQTIQRLQEAKPDIICITGDLVDANHTDVDVALEFAAEAVKIAPCYYIPGNHEGSLDADVYESLLERLTAVGITVLEDAQVLLTCGEDTISVAGRAWCPWDELDQLSDFDGYRLLLSHRPERLADYVAAEYDLVLTGHAHGGQFRLPFIGGIYAPHQGLFPEHDSGLHEEGDTVMFISRGIGNSVFPVRINNRPEVILITLACG